MPRFDSLRAPALASLAAILLLSGCESLNLPGPSPVLDEVTILSPREGARLIDTVRVRVQVTGREAPLQVELFVDRTELTPDSVAPWEFVWDTAGLAEGSSHRLRARASDAEGLVRESALVTVEIGSRTYEGDYGLFTINADGTDLREILSLDVLPLSAHVSPDGARLVFTGYTRDLDGDGLILPDGDEASSEVYLASADGTGLARRTFNSFVEEDTRWSPDGASIFFSSSRPGPGTLDLYEELIVGHATWNRTVTPGVAERFPRRAGDYVYFSAFATGSQRGAGVVWRQHVGTGAREELTSPGVTGESPGWFPLGDVVSDVSPDGATLAFSRNAGPSPDSPLGAIAVMLRDLASGAETVFLDGYASETFPRFSPNGNTLLVTGRDQALPNGGALLLMDAEGGARTVVGPLPADLVPLEADWLPGATLEADDGPDILFAGARRDLAP